jgi:hypothetical protein
VQHPNNPLCGGWINFQGCEKDTVVSHFQIANSGEAPLWICGVEKVADTDDVFDVDPPLCGFPMQISSGGSVGFGIRMNVPEAQASSDKIYSAEYLVRCNDPNQSLVTINVHGTRHPRPSSGECIELPDPHPTPDVIESLHDMIYGHLPEIEQNFPVGPDPSGISNHYLDVTISGLSQDISLKVLDVSGRLVAKSQYLNDLNILHIPLMGSQEYQFAMTAQNMQGSGQVGWAVSRIIRIGTFHSDQRILGLAAYGPYVFVHTEGEIDIVGIDDPAVPKKVSKIELGNCDRIEVRGDRLYALTSTTLTILDIRDPSSVKPIRAVPAFPGSKLWFGGDQMLLFNEHRIRVYGLDKKDGPRLLHEYEPMEALVAAAIWERKYVVLIGDSVYAVKSLVADELAKATPVPLSEIPQAFPGIRLRGKRRVSMPRLVLQDEYLLFLHDEQEIQILQRERIPYQIKK